MYVCMCVGGGGGVGGKPTKLGLSEKLGRFTLYTLHFCLHLYTKIMRCMCNLGGGSVWTFSFETPSPPPNRIN